MSPPTCGNRRALQKTCNDVFCPAGPITGATEDPRSLTQYQQSHCRALLRLAHVSALPCTPSNPQREPLVSLCRLHIQNMNLGLCDLGKISNCIFFDRYYDCDFKFAVKLQLNIVNNVQHRMSIVTLLKLKGKNNRNHHRNSYSFHKNHYKIPFCFGIIPTGITVVLLAARLHPTNRMHQIPVDTIIVYIKANTIPPLNP